MPTIAHRPAAQQDRERPQGRRLRAAELFATGVRQAEVARQRGTKPVPGLGRVRPSPAGHTAPRMTAA